MGSIYRGIIWIGNKLQPLLLLLFRLFWGYLFFTSGIGKFANMPQVISFFTSLDIPLPTFSAYLVAAVETIGGIGLILGFGSRLFALLLAIVTLTALLTDNIEQVRNVVNNTAGLLTQLPVTFFLTSIVIFAFGPGIFSIDAIIKR